MVEGGVEAAADIQQTGREERGEEVAKVELANVKLT